MRAPLQKDEEANHQESKGLVGKAGDALPPFKNHMIRQRVTRHGVIFPLPPAPQLPGCAMARDLVGVPKQGPVQKWLDQRKQWDRKFATAKRQVHKRFIDDLAVGYEGFGDGEFPPPSALAGRRRKGDAGKPAKRSKSMGLALWSLWGSKHDKMTMDREEKADKEDQDVEVVAGGGAGGEGARSFADLERQGTMAAAEAASPTSPRDGRSRSRRRRVAYERQDENNENGESQEDVAAETATAAETAMGQQFLTPGYQPPPPQQHQYEPGPEPEVGIGTTGKRAYVDGIAVPFSLKKEAETASMMTLTSNMSLGQGGLASPRMSTTSRPMSPADETTTAESGAEVVQNGEEEGKSDSIANANHEVVEEGKGKGKAVGIESATSAERPGLETFVTAAEGLPMVKGEGAS